MKYYFTTPREAFNFLAKSETKDKDEVDFDIVRIDDEFLETHKDESFYIGRGYFIEVTITKCLGAA